MFSAMFFNEKITNIFLLLCCFSKIPDLPLILLASSISNVFDIWFKIKICFVWEKGIENSLGVSFKF
jgi:hypothetical protein